MIQNPAQVFSDNWDVYKKVMECNYMHHAAFSTHTASLLSRMKQQPLRVLDIGCGDALPVMPHLLTQGHIQYTGFDLSAPALQMASVNLAAITGTITLKEGNMLSLLEQETKFFDLIISSFAIHHLQDIDKMNLLENCYKHLEPGGKMIYTDIFIDKQPGRDFYLDEYISNIRLHWKLLNENEKQLIFDHILQYDFPASLEKTIYHCKEFGFTTNIIFQPDQWHAMILLIKK